ncbi:unnamed protein product [Rangifer tarandus platyrhynchus]|uniref:Uncharacterized protein n=1 Tax=Rangifer tarandus platyrhynchus TaxID=3082113 RepID=A0ABN8XUP9_RANTA|nr:unnamed protein product [Rangifer tarandus platyrhynchus]
MGFFQARVLEWVAIFFSRESSRPRERTQVSSIADALPSEPPGKPKKYALVNYKYFMFKVVEPPLKKKKKEKSWSNIEYKSEEEDGVNLRFFFDEADFTKPYTDSWNTV